MSQALGWTWSQPDSLRGSLRQVPAQAKLGTVLRPPRTPHSCPFPAFPFRALNQQDSS